YRDLHSFPTRRSSDLYPDDLVSWYDHNSIGSTYFLAHPGDAGNIKWFNNHGINNYTANKMFDKDSYFIPDLLFDETLFGHPEKRSEEHTTELQSRFDL